MKKYPVILFFIASVMPTAEDFEAAEQLGPNVKFRNASFVPAEGCLEKCDGVAGAVPERYAEAYPSAEDAFAAFEEARSNGQEAPQAAPDAQPPKGDPAKPASAPKPANSRAKAASVVWKPNQ